MRDLWRVLSGQVHDDELVMVKESEEAGELEALQAELARDGESIPKNINTHPTSGMYK